MFKIILKNKMLSLSIFIIILYVILTMYKQKEVITTSIQSTVLPNFVTKQLASAMKADSDNVYIDNDILSGKLALPEVQYTDPSVPLSSEIEYVNEKDELTLEDLQKAGGIVFPNDYTEFNKFQSQLLKSKVEPERAYPALDMFPGKF